MREPAEELQPPGRIAFVSCEFMRTLYVYVRVGTVLRHFSLLADRAVNQDSRRRRPRRGKAIFSTLLRSNEMMMLIKDDCEAQILRCDLF